MVETTIMLECPKCMENYKPKVYNMTTDKVPIGPRTTFANYVDAAWQTPKYPYGHVDAFLTEHQACGVDNLKIAFI